MLNNSEKQSFFAGLIRERERDLSTDRRADGKIHQRFHFSPSEAHARGYIAITSSLIEYLLAKLLSFQGFIVFLMWEV